MKSSIDLKTQSDPDIDITRSVLMRFTNGKSDKGYRMEIQTKLVAGTRLYAAVAAYGRWPRLHSKTVVSDWSKSSPMAFEAYVNRRDEKLLKGYQIIGQDETFPLPSASAAATPPTQPPPVTPAAAKKADQMATRAAEVQACYREMASAASSGGFF